MVKRVYFKYSGMQLTLNSLGISSWAKNFNFTAA